MIELCPNYDICEDLYHLQNPLTTQICPLLDHPTTKRCFTPVIILSIKRNLDTLDTFTFQGGFKWHRLIKETIIMLEILARNG